MAENKTIPPKHIAIIPDGNRRWAQENGLMPWEGHQAGVANFRKLAHLIFNEGIENLTFWALSIDNLVKRSQTEIGFLVGLMKKEFADPKFAEGLMTDGIKIKFLGKWRELISDKDLHTTMDGLEELTKENTKGFLTLLIAYDGKTEMLEAIKNCKNIDISEENLKKHLWTGSMPPVDLAIRSGGEPHWSGGFMMWLTSDSQFYFTETKWPNFNKEELNKALKEYALRERRMGQ